MISKRARSMDASGIRKVFDLAANLKNPINLSIGLPDFDVPDAAKDAVKAAVDAGRNRYTPSGGIPALRDAVRRRCRERHGFEPGDVMITSGTSGGLTLALLATVDPGDEVLVPDPFFVSYPQLVRAAGGTPVFYDTHPDFRLRVDELGEVATERAKVLVLNSPSNPTGVTLTEDEVRSACDFARDRGLVVLSDEVYEPFSYGAEPASAARYYDGTITVNGWSKSHAMTGWRVGWAAGPAEVVNEMIKLQQFTFVCAPAPAQHAALATIDLDTSNVRETYAAKRDLACGILEEAFEFVRPDGAFYVFPKAPGSLTGTDFVKRAIEQNVLVIPGGVFSTRDTHFRVSFAAPDDTIREGCATLVRLAREGQG
ncbi:MAG: pyridoxal phosphate-dependent aminotransferase [Planctomycetota bacterium]|jgi:aspartate aminotransferase/aminotransferase